MWLFFQPADERPRPWQRYVKVVDPEEQEETSAKIPRIGLLWHEASTEEAVIYLGADLSCRQNATHSRDIDWLLNHPLGRPCP